MITATITRTVPITQLRPGAIIDGHTIDSIELAADGATALCFPPGRTDGRRVRIPLGTLDAEITVSAGDEDAAKAVQELERWLDFAEDRGENTVVPGALLAVVLPSGWTFALHGDQPTSNGRARKPAATTTDEEGA